MWLIGSSEIDLKTLKKDVLHEIWVPVKAINGRAGVLGELNISIIVFEQIVLAEGEYKKMMDMLNDDEDIDLPYALAHLAIGELDRLSELLMRLYQSSGRLLLRLAQMAAIEVDGDESSASILFRGNTLLTKMLEGYMRLIGGAFLESSVGPIIRRICHSKLELEIDPSKMKNSKNLNENGRSLETLAKEIWESIYLNRSKCPGRLKSLFGRIQSLVTISYEEPEMRLTCVSAFIFLRFFVPSILNPRLFNIVQFQPEPKSQRTLTLLAKTLQGLGNLTLFGVKEPFMAIMNPFIKNHLESFRDYIKFISTNEIDEGIGGKIEWTSQEFEGYGLPIALRSSLPHQVRDGIPLLPHLLDPVKDCSLLASLIGKSIANDNPHHHHHHHHHGPHLNSAGNVESKVKFVKICKELKAKSQRRYSKIIGNENSISLGSTGIGIGGNQDYQVHDQRNKRNGFLHVNRRRAGTVGVGIGGE
ncbi:Rho GTPase activation protein [Melampsora americana]|nr:Rho GTPase activation protein [Melampsora americana]